ncbi:MAG: hypothetical protein ABSA09_01955 [Desulfobaccales bacterium]|jgi:hypothetical protein
MKKLPFISHKSNFFSIFYYLSTLTVGPFSRAQSLGIDLLTVAIEALEVEYA